MVLTSVTDAPANARGIKRSLPASIFVSERTRDLRIGGLSLLDRLVVAVHRAGAGQITIVTDRELPPLKRSRALGIKVHAVPEAPVEDGPVLVATTELLVQTADVRRCIQHGGRLVTGHGVALPIGVASSSGPETEALLLGVPEVRTEGVAMRVENAGDARAAEKALWASLTSASDGLVDKVFNRPCGRALSKLLIHTPITPNMVSLASVLIGVLSAVLFAQGDYRTVMLAAILFQLSAIIDCVDGDLARMVFKESPLGKWIDLVGDQVVHVSVFAGIAFGLYRTGEASPVLALGGAAVLGVILSFLVVLRGMRQPSGEGVLRKLIDSATNRDFSVLVLVLAFFQKLGLFMWLAAIGSHVFWIVALVLQFRPVRRVK